MPFIKIRCNTGNTLSLLGVLFVGLKLTGHIDWPWVWVTAPLWIPYAAFLAAAVIGLTVISVDYYWKKWKDRKRNIT